MNMESGFRTEDKGRMSEDDAHDLANMMLAFLGEYPEGKKLPIGGDNNELSIEIPINTQGSTDTEKITSVDYEETLQLIDDLMKAKNSLERQNILTKFASSVHNAVWMILRNTLGRLKDFSDLRMKPVIDLDDLKEVRREIERLKQGGKDLAEAQIEYSNDHRGSK